MQRLFERIFREQAARPAGGTARPGQAGAGEASFSRDLPIHMLFERQVEKTPGAVALIFESSEMSFEALNRRANRMAHLLIQRGIRRGDLVGLSLPKGMDMIAAVLAILKAGGAYLPLDPTYPAAHLQNILQDARPGWVITTSSFCANFPFEQKKILCLDIPEEEIASQQERNPDVHIKSDDLVYCIYTSGSTGKPKGVLIEHRSLVNFTCGAAWYYQIQAGDRMLQFASLNFDTSAEEIFPTLCSGATLVLRTPDMLDSVRHFLRCCREWRLTILDLPTAFWHELVIYLQKSGEALPESLRLVIIGGERVSPAHLAAWHRLNTASIHLDNTYGLTECTCVSVRGRLLPEEREKYEKQEASIGKAVDNTNLYILDENRRMVPEGEAGELYVGGEGLARGYLNLPELTAERFLPDPFAKQPGKRMYKTGDVVRMRGDGSLEYLGRSDEQIKIRGFRIEPAEIEAVLMQAGHVGDALVVKRSDPSGTEQLLAYLIPEKNQSINIKDLRIFMKTRLPRHMLPAYYTILKEFPLSLNNKIDKNALPDPDWGGSASARPDRQPQDAGEQKMLKIWEEMLGHGNIGLEDNFFDIGGHSLLAARMMTEIESQFGMSVPLVTLLENPTIRDLTRIITGTGWRPSWKSLVRLKADGNLTPLFLIHAIGGDVLSYRNLVIRLDGMVRPIYGLRSQGVDGISVPLERVEDMAALYLKEIREVQPHGPYLLGGYSFGGTVAFEMAQQLISSGEQTALLAMFDTVVMENLPADLQPGRLELFSDRIERFWFILRKWFNLNLPKKIEYTRKSLSVAYGRLSAFLRNEKYVNPQEKGDLERWQRKPAAFQKIETINNKASAEYVTKPYAGSVTYFKARQREWSEMVRPEPLWRKIAQGGLSVYEIEGNHNSIMVEPYVQSLAVQLKRVLEEIRDGGKE